MVYLPTFTKKNTQMYPNVGIKYTYHTLYMDPLDIGRDIPENTIWSNHQSDCMKHVLTWWRTKVRLRARGIPDVSIDVYHHLFVSWCWHAQKGGQRPASAAQRKRERVFKKHNKYIFIYIRHKKISRACLDIQHRTDLNILHPTHRKWTLSIIKPSFLTALEGISIDGIIN